FVVVVQQSFLILVFRLFWRICGLLFLFRCNCPFCRLSSRGGLLFRLLCRFTGVFHNLCFLNLRFRRLFRALLRCVFYLIRFHSQFKRLQFLSLQFFCF